MHWLFILMLAFIGFATLAMMIREGLWNNTITIVIHAFSGFLAFAYYGPLARWLDESVTDGTYTFFMDMLSLYAIYVVTFVVLRLLSNQLSRERVRFKMPVEWSGSIATAILGGYLLSGFVGATMHTAPLSHDFLGGAILAESADDVELKLTRPDIAWLRLYGAVIARVMPSALGEELFAEGGPIDRAAQHSDYSRFFPGEKLELGDFWTRLFIVQYKNRRDKFADAPGLRVNRS